MVGRLSENFVTIAAVLMLVAGVALAACSREGSAVPEPVPAPPPPSVVPSRTPSIAPVVVPLPHDVSGTPVVAPTPVSVSRADHYMALVPSTLRSGHSEGVSISLLSEGDLATGLVRLALLDGDRPVVEVSGIINGSGMLSLPVPHLPAGQYRMEIEGPGFKDSASVKLAPGTMVLLETDKPIYKPGQTIHIRLITLDMMLKPWPAEVTVEVQDSKGIKVYRTTATTDDFGMASVELPLSTEPNLGVWKVTAALDEQTTQLDVRVEEYVLPKYEVIVSTAKDWVLANEPISGTVSAEYTFGKPVRGELEIVASRYVGNWEEYATLVQPLVGETTFKLPPVQYVAGVPEAGGLGNVTLRVTVREKSTGYEEETTRLLTVAPAPISVKVIPESGVFKPSLPMSFLVVTETPDGKPVDEEVEINLFYMGKDFDSVKQDSLSVRTERGKAILTVEPPKDAAALNLEATAGQAHTSLTIQSGYSPSGNFIHLEQVTEGPVHVGGTVEFHVSSTKEASNFYYEVLSRGRVIFSDVFNTPNIALTATQLMAPSSRLLVYQILPNNEVAADFLPFSVEADYPHDIKVAFGSDQVKPGEAVDIEVRTEGPARVGLVAVDKSVFILAENRLNLRQVFDELERLYLEPQVELHEARFLNTIITRGASETFDDAGLVVITNMDVPDGEKHSNPVRMEFAVAAAAPAAAPRAVRADSSVAVPTGLAEVQRVRQFFPETWLWTDLTTDEQGHAVLPVEAPDSITTWMLRAVGLSKEHGFGIDEAQLTVFQPFFLQVDLPFSAIRGEEFPVKIALYNYMEDEQDIFVEIEEADWFDLLDQTAKSATVAGNDIGGVEFTIRPNLLGTNQIKVTARSPQAADAVIKDLIVEPEGVEREIVENLVLSDGDSYQLHTLLPPDTIDGSGRAYVAITGSYLTQTIEGLEGLLRMPFGCGEQNMILFAPNVFVARYLRETGQLKPEVMAKAEHLMMTGYQRELTYRRADGSFSAFGDSDREGSLWLTAFVLKTFAQAKDLMYIDEGVLDDAAAWITDHQLANGSFEPVGFLHHQELLGGLKGKNALTAYVAIALLEDGQARAAGRAVGYLEDQVDTIDDGYTMAITAYALELAGSPEAGAASERLMDMAKQDDDGIYWGDDPVVPLPLPLKADAVRYPEPGPSSASVEATGYATLALLERGDRFNASRATRWLASQRNAFGGFASTQDTVVGLQALTAYATNARSDVDLVVELRSGDWSKEIRITSENADVLQTIQVPLGREMTVDASGKGDAVLQLVTRYNLPDAGDVAESAFEIDVDYGTERVEVDDLITVSVGVRFVPPEPIESGMVVLDIAVPTGFAPVGESVEELVESQPNVKRYDVAGRKVILYIEDLAPNETISFEFQARALYPVRAKDVTSQAYSYYRPEWRGETLAGAMTVTE